MRASGFAARLAAAPGPRPGRTVPGLHEILALRRPTYLLDAETTGTDKQTARIIELAAQRWEPGIGLARDFRTLVRPGVPIPAAVTRVHGITDAVVNGCRVCGRPAEGHPAGEIVGAALWDGGPHAFAPWPTWRQLAPRIKAAWAGVDFAGKNVRFDLRVVAAEMRREGVEWGYEGALVICSDAIARIAEPRNLAALYRRHLGRDMPGSAHSALDDVRGTAELIAAQLEDFPSVPRDAAALHAASWPDYLDSEGYFVLDDEGTPRVGRWGKHNGWAMRDVPRDYWKYMTRKDKDFPADAKAIAARAIRGLYPGDKEPAAGDLLDAIQAGQEPPPPGDEDASQEATE